MQQNKCLHISEFIVQDYTDFHRRKKYEYVWISHFEEIYLLLHKYHRFMEIPYNFHNKQDTV